MIHAVGSYVKVKDSDYDEINGLRGEVLSWTADKKKDKYSFCYHLYFLEYADRLFKVDGEFLEEKKDGKRRKKGTVT
jgi:hypothetical protein